MTTYTIRQLARIAGVSVRTLHHYDHIGLLKPSSYGANGYRYYDEEAGTLLQQILFFRELDFSLEEIRRIMTAPGFRVRDALDSHRELLQKRADRISQLLRTVDKTIAKLEGEISMEIKEYYQGLSDAEIEDYREEARRRWGQDTVRESEARILKMGKDRMSEVQAEGGAIFQAVADLMPLGASSPEVQTQIAKWREWLEHFSAYSDEALLGLGRMYSEDARFVAFFERYAAGLPEFFTQAVEHYCARRDCRV